MPISDVSPTSIAGVAHFFGEFFHGLDEKNRVALPAAWRKTARDRVPAPWILVPSPVAPCILGFGAAEFESELHRIVALGSAANAVLTAADLQVFSRQFSARARPCMPDRQGRLLLPSEMLAAGGFGREVVLVGNRRRIEIWTPSEWQLRSASDQSIYARVASLAGL